MENVFLTYCWGLGMGLSHVTFKGAASRPAHVRDLPPFSSIFKCIRHLEFIGFVKFCTNLAFSG